MRLARTILPLLAALGLGAQPARADEVVLRATARLAPGADATLADIADLSGPRAEALGDTVVVPAAELRPGWTRIDLARVTAALDSRGHIAWGLLAMRGSECSVGVATAPEPKAAAPRPSGPAGEPADAVPTGTVKGFIAAKVAASLALDPAFIRLAFDAQDEDLLSMPTAGRIVEARITGTSDRVPVRVSVFEGERLLASRSVGVGVLVRRRTAVTIRPVRRGQAISADDLAVEERWVGPGLAPVAPEDAIGLTPRTSLDEGQTVIADDVQPPLVIKRGDLVTVSSISGGVLVRTTARARSAANDGEAVELETLEPDRKQRRTFTARASGRGRAVVSSETHAPGTDVPHTENPR